MPAPGLPAPTLTRRLDIAAYKKAINAWQPGGVNAMFAFSVTPNFGDPTNIAFFAGSDVPGGDFETLVLEPWLTGTNTPGTGPTGLAITNPIQLALTIATLRLNTAIIQAAAAGGVATTAATFAKVANTGAYADLSGLPTIPVLPALAKVAISGAYGDLSGLPMIPDVVAETTRAEAAEAISAIGAVIVVDANHAAAVADLGVIVNPLTAPRTITLPPRAQWPLNKPFRVSDESGNASAATSITVVAAPGDTINGSASNTLIIESAYGFVAPCAGATTWIAG